jgi:hypothetical protein
MVPGTLVPPSGPGPFPAVLLLRGGHGASRPTRDRAMWFQVHGDVALIAASLPRATSATAAYRADVVNRNRPGRCCGATVGCDAAASADAHRRVEEFSGLHLRDR